ncbi:MAG: hypothetical protein ACRD07_15445 [Acidimicrobiales bacterium]
MMVLSEVESLGAGLVVVGLVNFKVIEVIAGRTPSAVDYDRLVEAWALPYRLLLEHAT